MSGSEVYLEIVGIVVFLIALWIGGFVFQKLKLSSIVGQILVGIILGPNVLDYVPLFLGEEKCPELKENQTARLLSASNSWFEAANSNYALDDSYNSNFGLHTIAKHVVRLLAGGEEGNEGGEPTNVWVVLGQLGVTLLIMESGMHVDFPTLRKVGASAFMVAIVGTFMPMILGFGFSYFLGFGAIPNGIAMGAVLAPTSVGIALKLLADANVLNSVFGQTIVTAAFTDDIFSLVTLTVLLQIAAGDLTAFGVIAPFLYSFIFMAVTFAIAIYVVPKTVPPLLQKVAKRWGQNARDRVHLGLMVCVLGLYTYTGNFIGSHLLGAFVAGVAFVPVPRTKKIWAEEMDTINEWLLRIFFGATVGFAVPVNELLTFDSFWRGLIVGFIPGILGKVCSGFVLKGRRMVVGWAMVGRGEFAFLVAETLRSTEFVSLNEPFLSADAFSVSVWALLVATVVAPIAFGAVLAAQQKREHAEHALDKIQSGDQDDGQRKVSMLGSIPARAFSSIRFGSVVNLKSQVSKFVNGGKEIVPTSLWWVNVGCHQQDGLISELYQIFEDREVKVKSFVNEGDDDGELFTFLVEIIDESDEAVAMAHSEESIRRLRTHNIDQGEFGEQRPRVRRTMIADDFFRYDINILVENLRNDIIRAINGESTVKITRKDAMRRPAPDDAEFDRRGNGLNSMDSDNISDVENEAPTESV